MEPLRIFASQCQFGKISAFYGHLMPEYRLNDWNQIEKLTAVITVVNIV